MIARTDLRILTALAALATAPAGTMAATIDVPADHPTIQAAIDAASDGDVIVLADGTYTGPGNRDVRFGGALVTVRSASGAEECIIDCGGAGRGFIFDAGETSQARLEGLTIINGSVSFPGGGAVYCRGSSPLIINCIFRQNTAGAGGAVYCEAESAPLLINCILAQNAAQLGGGMFNQNSEPRLINCTIAGNEGSGGGIFNLEGGASITNGIIWFNTPDQIVDGNGSASTLDYCNVQGGWSGDGVNNIDADPKFVDVAAGNVRLAPGSPCIDASNTALLSGPFDLAGQPRAVDDPATPDTGLALYEVTVDMGVFEFQPTAPAPCPADLNRDAAVNVTDLIELLVSWGPCGK